MPERKQGKVDKWFEDRGFGFISSDSIEKPAFVHISQIENRVDLEVGETVEFELVEGKKGKEAHNVKNIK